MCGTGKADLMRSLGADEVIDYPREDFTDGTRHWDLIVDTAGHRRLTDLRRALTPRGTLVLVGSETGGRWLGGIDRTLRALLLSPFIRHHLRGLVSTERPDDLRFLRETIESGRLTPVLDRTLPFTELPEAVRYIHAGHARGKVVVTIP
ncbi:zinc-binding dehydrogenase [Embleya sp. NPDC059237]|uniref:zinc-binding dehydrogenase n=1 Tax=Embleya sp. NPDC059237 TaxID=3346784 RepID=UPI0036C5A9B3